MNRLLVERWREEAGHRQPRGRLWHPKLIAGSALMAMVYAIDAGTTLRIAVTVLYTVVLLICGDVLERREFKFLTAGCVGLTVLAFVLVHGHHPETQAALRLAFSIASILITTALVLRNEADRALLRAQARILDLADDAIILRDREGRVAYWNRGAERLFGWKKSEAVGRNLRSLLSTRFSPSSSADAEAKLLRTNAWQGEVVETTKSGRQVPVLSRWTMQADRNGRPSTVLEVGIDIGPRREAEEALRASEERFRTIFNTLAIGIWEHDFRPVKEAIEQARAAGVSNMRAHVEAHPEFVRDARRSVRITDVNATALRMMDVPSKEMFFTHLSDFLPEDEHSFAHCILAIDEGLPTFEHETVVRTLKGEIIHIFVALSFPPGGAGLDRIPGSIVNITERVRMGEALDEARGERDRALRAATVGEVSASIAHEVNQPLAAISAYAAAALRWMDRDPPDIAEARTALGDVAAAADHAAEVVRRVRQLLGRAKPEMSDFGIDRVIEDTLQFMRRESALHGITIETSLKAPGATIRGDCVLIQHVLMNLMTNAIQAMEGTPRHERRLRIASAETNGAIEIEVVDGGPGFRGEDIEAAFAPFRTTKESGMGLGLAMCRSIVSAHNGDIRLDNASGGGASVRITLPRDGRES